MTALVTGAGSGIGRRLAERLAEEGHAIVAVDLPGKLDATVAAVEALGQRAIEVEADVRDAAALAAGVDEALAALGGRLEVVCANAGVHSHGLVDELAPEDFRRILDVNLTGAWATCRACSPHLDRGSAVCLTGSVASVRGAPRLGHYVAAKHGVIGLMRSLAIEWGARGIRVNAVLPSLVDTPMVNNEVTYRQVRPDLEAPTWDDVREAAARSNPLGIGAVTPDDVADAVLFLASERARCITGTALAVDAGALLL